jgi:hypothetical protein
LVKWTVQEISWQDFWRSHAPRGASSVASILEEGFRLKSTYMRMPESSEDYLLAMMLGLQ